MIMTLTSTFQRMEATHAKSNKLHFAKRKQQLNPEESS
jgi:hypothetical protein